MRYPQTPLQYITAATLQPSQFSGVYLLSPSFRISVPFNFSAFFKWFWLQSDKEEKIQAFLAYWLIHTFSRLNYKKKSTVSNSEKGRKRNIKITKESRWFPLTQAFMCACSAGSFLSSHIPDEIRFCLTSAFIMRLNVSGVFWHSCLILVRREVLQNPWICLPFCLRSQSGGLVPFKSVFKKEGEANKLQWLLVITSEESASSLALWSAW